MYKELSKWLRVKFEENNLDPIYSMTIIIIVTYILFNYKVYKNWNNETNGQKFFSVMTLLVVILLVVLSFLRVFNII